MATGDDAIAGGMSPVLGTAAANTIDTLITETRDHIANGPNRWKPGVTLPASKISGGSVPVGNGGTGANNATDARANLGAVALAALAPGNVAVANAIPVYNAAGQLTTVAPSLGGHVVDFGSLLARVGPGASIPIYSAGGPADSGYTIAYINHDGRLSRGASGAQFKDDITAVDPLSLGDLFPEFSSYVMKDDPGRLVRYGYIAQHLDARDETRPFVVYEREPVTETVVELVTETTIELVTETTIETYPGEDGEPVEREVERTVEKPVERIVEREIEQVVGYRIARDENGNPIPLSIDFIGLLLAQVAQLNVRLIDVLTQVAQLTARLTVLEGGAS